MQSLIIFESSTRTRSALDGVFDDLLFFVCVCGDRHEVSSHCFE